MSQEQPQRPPESIKYGDVFAISGELASQPVAPQDAAILKEAESGALGQSPAGAPSALVQLAADSNESRGVLGHEDKTDIVGDRGAVIAEAEVGGYRVITEAIGGQVIGQYGQPVDGKEVEADSATGPDAITIGEALEATAISVGDKAIDQSDAAAIQEAEVRATGLDHLAPGGVGAEAQSAATYNQTAAEEDKTKIRDVLTDATAKLTTDKPTTREDAGAVISAEIRNKADLSTHPGGVAATVAAAARLNQEK